jgi:undecaprenyl-diphosphatase
VVEHRAGPVDWLFVALTVAGYAGLLWVLAAPLLARLGGLALLVPTALTAGTVWTADLLAQAGKAIVDRPRPYRVVPEAHPLVSTDVGSSFPSGHAATSFAGAVILAYLFRRGVPWLFVLAVAVAFSRVYVGAHYPADVLAGALLGSAVGLVVVLAVLRPRRRTSEARRRSGAGPPGG